MLLDEHDVLAEPDRMEALLFGGRRSRRQEVAQAVGATRGGEKDAELHGAE